MSLRKAMWRGGLWGSQFYPNGNGPWRGGLWASQRQGGGGGGSDPLWNNVASLLHMDTVGTTFTDEKGHAWTTKGAAQIVADAQAFGGAHGECVSSGDYIQLPANADHRLTGPFCVEMRIKPTSVTSGRYWLGSLSGGAGHIWLKTPAAGELTAYVFGTEFASRAAISVGETYHVAIDRDDTDTVRFFVDGVEIDSFLKSGVDTSDRGWDVGSTPNIAGPGASCYIDEFRVTVGASRYQANFTPPSEPFPNGP